MTRCCYFFGVEGAKAVLKMVRHESELHKPFEKALCSQEFSWKPDEDLLAEVTVSGPHIQAKLNGKSIGAVEDATYPRGQIGIVSDMPARFDERPGYQRSVGAGADCRRACPAAVELEAREAANPRMVLWKKFRTEGFGVGRNLRFGDLEGDGRMDIVFGQVLHHGPKDANSEVSCLTAVTLEGKVLWQIGEPDPWKDNLSNDVAFQIHDLDGDGRNEVIYCKGMELIVADGRTGRTKYKASTPATPANTPAPRNRFPRILGDSIYFCDFRGQGRAGDLVLKDRYNSLWVFNDKLELLWQAQCNTGHYPFAYDIDGDGKDELMMGYTSSSHTGKQDLEPG